MTEVSYTFSSSQFSSSTWTVYPTEEPIANVNFFEWVTGGQVGIVHCNVIGNGGYGDVHEMYDITKAKSFARKVYRCSSISETLRREICAIERLGKHINIVETLAHGKLDFSWYIDLELCDINLHDWIHGKWPPPRSANGFEDPFLTDYKPTIQDKQWQIHCIMSHLLRGTEHMHRHNLVHRDLKPRNVVYSIQSKSWKLIDFGFVRNGSAEQNSSSARHGTPGYRAPELIHWGKFSFATDLWALGCIFYELHTTFSPFKDDGAIREWALTKPFEAVKIPFPHDAIYIMRSLEAENALLNKMLDREGEERPSARDVEKEMNDDWVTCLFRGRGSPQTNFRKMPMFIRS